MGRPHLLRSEGGYQTKDKLKIVLQGRDRCTGFTSLQVEETLGWLVRSKLHHVKRWSHHVGHHQILEFRIYKLGTMVVGWIKWRKKQHLNSPSAFPIGVLHHRPQKRWIQPHQHGSPIEQTTCWPAGPHAIVQARWSSWLIYCLSSEKSLQWDVVRMMSNQNHQAKYLLIANLQQHTQNPRCKGQGCTSGCSSTMKHFWSKLAWALALKDTPKY